ncbi:MAG: SDR family oxidoreductase [Crocinitomicaceae bacterium]
MRTIIVIGGSSGIGLQLVKNLAKTNKVLATYHTSEKTELENVEWHQFDVSDPDFSWYPDKIDGFVYCPGSINLKPFKRFSVEDFLSDFNLQVGGAIEAIQNALPRLKKGHLPSIVLFSSIAATQGFRFHTQVSASKGAIEGLSKALAAELAPEIRVNTIAPSLTNTKLASKLLNTEEKINQNMQRHPLKTIGEPDDIAQVAAFLLGTNSKWLTGQIIHVDGGMSTLKT